jgi:DNA polymerase I-like protein with 3'-5' exonuclease and polymerase domains
MSPEDVFEYGCSDVRDTWALHEFYREKRTEKEETAYQDFTDFIRVLFRMEERGMLVDRQDLAERLTGCETAMSELETEFQGKVARGVNLASSQQVAKWFGMRHADDLHLSQVQGDRKPVADIVLKWRQFAKASGTYLEPLEKYLVKREKRMRDGS